MAEAIWGRSPINITVRPREILVMEACDNHFKGVTTEEGFCSLTEATIDVSFSAMERKN